MSKHHKCKPPRDKRKSRCCIGCVESSPQNESSNNAAVIQSFSATAISVFACGATDPGQNFFMSLEATSDDEKSEDSSQEEPITEGRTFADALVSFIQKKVQEKESKVNQ